MKKTTKLLSIAIAFTSLVACKSKTVSTDDPKLKAMIDSIVRVRVEKYVQVALSQYNAQQQAYPSDYRKIAKEEGERAAGRAAQEKQSQDDAVLNAQSGY